MDNILLMSNFDGDLPIPSKLKCSILSSRLKISFGDLIMLINSLAFYKAAKIKNFAKRNSFLQGS